MHLTVRSLALLGNLRPQIGGLWDVVMPQCFDDVARPAAQARAAQASATPARQALCYPREVAQTSLMLAGVWWRERREWSGATARHTGRAHCPPSKSRSTRREGIHIEKVQDYLPVSVCDSVSVCVCVCVCPGGVQPQCDPRLSPLS